MAYLMTDVAAGSQAARQLQQNIVGSQYDAANLAASAEETQLKLQQDRLAAAYAPQMAAAQAEQEKLRLDKMRLQKTMEDAQYTADTESTKKLNQWMQGEGKTATDADIIRKAAAFKMEAGRVEEGSKLMGQAEKLDATEIANKAKKLAETNESIGKAFVAVEAIDPNDMVKFNEFVGRFPPETTKAITDQVGKENWEKYTPQEKKQVLSRLFLNGKGLLAEQLKAIELEKAKVIVEKDKDVANIKADASKAVATTRATAAVDVADIAAEGRVKAAETAAAAKIKAVEEKAAADLEKQKLKDADDLAKEKQKAADAMERLKEQDASKERMREAEDKAKERIKNMEDNAKIKIEKMRDDTLKTIAQAKLDAKDKPKADDPIKDEKFYFQRHDKIVKDGKKEEDALVEAVTKADAARTKSSTASWYQPDAYKQDKYNDAYTKAVTNLNDFRKKQYKEELDVIDDMPDSPTKRKLVSKIQEKLRLVEGGEDKKLDEKPSEAAPVAPAAAATPPTASSAPAKKAYIEISPDVRVDASLPKDRIENIKKSPQSFYGLDKDEMWSLKQGKLAIVKIPEGATTAVTSNKFTAEQQTWFDAAKKANPNMSDEDIIAEGKKRKKL